MAENQDLLICPLCQGHGELRRGELIEGLRNVALQNQVNSCLGESQPEASTECVAVAAPDAGQRDFQKDVHCWNPQLPMWRRSPKE